MRMFTPSPLSATTLTEAEIAQEKKDWKKYGPCAVGRKALFLNSRFIERKYYIPVTAIQRVYKRVAMSRAGFTGKGMFGSIPYLVVEYDNGREVQCTFKYEDNVDLMLAYIAKAFPNLKRMSRKAEDMWDEKQKRIEEKKQRVLNSGHQEQIREIEDAIAYLGPRPDLYEELSAAAKAKRAYDRSKPAYKWVALAIVIAGVLSAVYGAYSLIGKTGNFGLYFLLFGLAAIFMFSGANVLPTARNNRKAVEKRLADAIRAMDIYMNASPGDFPVPARYAHPAVMNRMIMIIADERAQTTINALEVLKDDLKKINSSVTVEQEEYEEIIAIKPMFLVFDYK